MDNFRMTDRDIADLITISKTILAKTPRNGFKEGTRYREFGLELSVADGVRADAEDGMKFLVFGKQNIKIPQGFSVGLRCVMGARTVPLVRYNGAHGEFSRAKDGHFSRPHIHRMTAAELASGSTHPRPNSIEITDKYETFEEAMEAFFPDINVFNFRKFFPPLKKNFSLDLL